MAILKVVSGQGYGRTYPILEPYCQLGRNTDCQASDLFGASPDVSRHHARIEKHGNSFIVSDSGSKRGTRLNGCQICQPTVLRDGDRISICGFELLFKRSSEAVALGEAATDMTRFFEHIDESSIESTCDPRVSDASVSARDDVRMLALVEMLSGLGESLDLYHVLESALAALLRIFPQADRGFVGLKQDQADMVVPAAVKHRDPECTEQVRVCRTIVRRVMTTGESVRLFDASQASLLKDSESIGGLHLRSILCAPLVSSDGDALGVVQIDTADEPYHFHHADLQVLAGVARLVSLAVQYSHWHRRALEKQAIQHDLETARRVQKNLLPREWPSYGNYRFFPFYEAALHVAGDYYDYIPLPDGRLAVVLADAEGKGVSAALLMMMLSGELKLRLASESGPGEALSRVNQRLLRSDCDGTFVTVCMAVLDLKSDEVVLVNAGHPDPLRRRGDGTVEPVVCQSRRFPLGIDLDERYPETRIRLAPEDRLVLFSDGFTEARNIAGDLYCAGRLRKAIAEGGADVEKLGRHVVEDVQKFSIAAGQSDDMCMVCFGQS